MLLLIRHRYPALANVLSFAAAAAFVAIGATCGNKMMIVMGVVSLALATARTAAKRRATS
jgi:hypothetical protein